MLTHFIMALPHWWMDLHGSQLHLYEIPDQMPVSNNVYTGCIQWLYTAVYTAYTVVDPVYSLQGAIHENDTKMCKTFACDCKPHWAFMMAICQL